jgi:hypothetical protein
MCKAWLILFSGFIFLLTSCGDSSNINARSHWISSPNKELTTGTDTESEAETNTESETNTETDSDTDSSTDSETDTDTDTDSDTSQEEELSEAEQFQLGQTEYNKHCKLCHKEKESTSVDNKTFEDIKEAIQEEALMKGVANLQQLLEETKKLEAISYYLLNDSPN